MKAIRIPTFGGPEVLQQQEIPEPKLTQDTLLIDVKAVGINPVDTYIRSGQYAGLPNLPYTPGFDAAGIVEAVGADVDIYKPGDRIYCSGSLTGTYAEKTLCRAEHVHPLPQHLSFSQGAGLGIPYATAFRALFHKGNVREGQSILIHGASGGVGLAALQLAKQLRLRIFATAATDEGQQLVQEQGADHVLDHNNPERMDQIRQQNAGRGINLILEMLANANLAMDLELLAPGGKVVVIGNRGTIEINPRLLMAKDAAILGLLLMNATPEELADIHAGIIIGLQSHILNPIVGLELPLDQADQAHCEVMQAGHCGKIVLVTE